MSLEVVPTANGVAAAGKAEQRLRAFLEVMRGRRRPLIQLQHNPDPDALGSGCAVKHLIKRVFRVDPVVAFTGSVGRAENRAMMRYLKIQIVPAFKVSYRQHDLVIVVDTQPGAGTCRLPEGVVADVVIDHHPGDRKAFAGVRLALVDADYGATSSLVGEMLLANGFSIPERIATALVYGIQTDTLDLARNASKVDEDVFTRLYPLADLKLLGRIQRARVPQAYFLGLERGLRNALVHGNAVTTHLGDVEHPDMIAEVADLLFRLEGVTWSFVTGSHARVLYASIRAVEQEGIDAGAVARAVAGARGSGGGHESMAAAQIPVGAGDDPDAPAREAQDALARFLEAARAKRSLTRPLTLPPDVPTRAEPRA